MSYIGKSAIMTWAAAAAAVAVASGGVALASSAGSPGTTISGCVNKVTRVLRVARHCSPGERSLTWNQVGPPGETGKSGKIGGQGPPGAPGPSHAWTARSGSVVTITGPATFTPVVTTTVTGGGDTVASADVLVANGSGVPVSVGCELLNGATDLEANQVTIGSGESENVYVSGSVANTETQFSVVCTQVTGNASDVDAFATITVIAVGALN